MTDFLIGRQQILDSNLKTIAYEILFRGKDFDLSIEESATNATNQVITDTILEIGLNQIVGAHKAFINFTTQNILDKTQLHLPKDRIVIEVLESVKVDERVVSSLKELSQRGYIIALDDFVLEPEWKPLLEFANIIKLDIMARSMEDTRLLIEQLKPYKLVLLAEKVETHQEFELMKSWGCRLFQGFFFSKPNIVEGKRLGVNQAGALQLLAAINTSSVEYEDLNKIISHDVGLSYKLLHYINSSFFSLPYKIASIKQAIVFLGMNELKRWVGILTLSSLSEKPISLLQISLLRAKMCELLALELGEDGNHYFFVGMLSNLDSIMDMPIEKILVQLPLTTDIIEAILHNSGKVGTVLHYVISYERWELNSTSFQDIDEHRIAAIYLESINWSNQVLGNL